MTTRRIARERISCTGTGSSRERKASTDPSRPGVKVAGEIGYEVQREELGLESLFRELRIGRLRRVSETLSKTKFFTSCCILKDGGSVKAVKELTMILCFSLQSRKNLLQISAFDLPLLVIGKGLSKCGCRVCASYACQ